MLIKLFVITGGVDPKTWYNIPLVSHHSLSPLLHAPTEVVGTLKSSMVLGTIKSGMVLRTLKSSITCLCSPHPSCFPYSFLTPPHPLIPLTPISLPSPLPWECSEAFGLSQDSGTLFPCSLTLLLLFPTEPPWVPGASESLGSLWKPLAALGPQSV